MIELEQLKQLVLDGGYDAESKREVAALEERLQRALMAEKLQNNPVIEEFTDYLLEESKRVEYLLTQDRDLPEVERKVLFKYRDILERFTGLFTGKEKESIRNSIKELLIIAKDA